MNWWPASGPGSARGRRRGGLRDRVRLGAAVAPVPARVDLARVPQVPPVEVGEQRVQEHELGVRGLPDQEVGGPLVPRRANEQVDIGDVGLVQIAREYSLVDLVRTQLARGYVGGERRGSVG